jgi:hypothetical protein
MRPDRLACLATCASKGLDQPFDRAAGASEVALDRLAAPGGGMLGAQRKNS